MNNLNILIVEGNLREENKNFSKVGIQTHTESLKESLNYFSKDLNLIKQIEIQNACKEIKDFPTNSLLFNTYVVD